MKGAFLITFPILMSGVLAVSFFDIVLEEWEDWKLSHRKTYNTTLEEKFRMKIYMENKAKIAKHNQKANMGEQAFFLKMNNFGDQLHHEIITSYHGYQHDTKKKLKERNIVGASYISPAHLTLPPSLDWRTKGAVTPVKSQGQCGSCWSFSATGALEGQHFRKTGVLLSLSEQNLVDCSRSYGNHGCNGGLMDYAFQYVKDNGGLDTELSYPYEGKEGKCRFNRKNIGAVGFGFVDLPEGDEEKLMEALAAVGPIAIAIDASHETFQFYSHGIYTEPDCKPDELDHAVLLVGYGTEKGRDYWLVKNSWGTTWGEDGYIKIARNAGNMCGVASSASYPIV